MNPGDKVMTPHGYGTVESTGCHRGTIAVDYPGQGIRFVPMADVHRQETLDDRLVSVARVLSCPHPHKHRWTTKGEAKKGRKGYANKGQRSKLTPYLCACGWWHLATKATRRR